jgi:hypothetical protein
VRLSDFSTKWLRVAVTQNRFQAAIEGTVIGLSLGLIDVHSTDSDSFNAMFAYLIAGLVLGLRHGGRSWQAWLPLGWCFYLMHRAAIAYGYRPPYVEADADSALLSLYVLWPGGLGLALGVLVRFTISGFAWAIRFAPTEENQDRSGPGNREITQPADIGRTPAQRSAATSTERLPRQRLTVRKFMTIVSLIAIHLATLRALLIREPVFGYSTFYSAGYSESRFLTLRVGMSGEEVEAIVGQPLRKVPWNQDMGPHDEEMWQYSDRPDYTGNYWRRWVYFENGKVVEVINDFWLD